MKDDRSRDNGGHRPSFHLPAVPRPAPYWARLVPPGELPTRAVVIRLVLALVLAIGLWVRVSADQDPAIARTFDGVPVTVLNPPGYYPVQQPPPVTVHLEGLSSDLKDAPPPAAIVDLIHVPPTATGPFPVRIKGLPSGVELRGVTPPTIKLRLEKKASKMVRVTVQVFGTPPGYMVSQPAVSPSMVKITGPSHTVDSIVEARVSVNESNFRHDRVLSVEPTAFDSSGHAVSRRILLIQPSEVTVRIGIRPQPVVQSIAVVPVITGTVATGYRISNVTVLPQTVTVVSSAPVPFTSTLQTVPITVDGWTVTQTLAVPLVVPPNLTLQRPVQANVTVYIAPAPGSAVSTAQVLIVGKRRGTTATVEPSTIKVVYQGPIPVLNAAGAPRAVLNLGNRQPGVYYLSPTVTTPDGLTLQAVVPSRLRVVITAPPQPHAILSPTASPTAARILTPTRRATARATPRPRPTTSATRLPALPVR